MWCGALHCRRTDPTCGTSTGRRSSLPGTVRVLLFSGRCSWLVGGSRAAAEVPVAVGANPVLGMLSAADFRVDGVPETALLCSSSVHASLGLHWHRYRGGSVSGAVLDCCVLMFLRSVPIVHQKEQVSGCVVRGTSGRREESSTAFLALVGPSRSSHVSRSIRRSPEYQLAGLWTRIGVNRALCRTRTVAAPVGTRQARSGISRTKGSSHLVLARLQRLLS